MKDYIIVVRYNGFHYIHAKMKQALPDEAEAVRSHVQKRLTSAWNSRRSLVTNHKGAKPVVDIYERSTKLGS